MDAGQQEALFTLGQSALTARDLPSLMQRAVALVASALDTTQGAIWELLPESGALLLRAGVGWRECTLGDTTIPAADIAQDGPLSSGMPVAITDWSSQLRYKRLPLLHEHGVRSSLCVVIHGANRPYGVLSVYCTTHRSFTPGEVRFLQAAANILALATGRAQAEEAFRLNEDRFQRLAENAADIIYRYRLTPTPGFDYVSPVAAAITGYTPEEYYADPALLLRLTHPADRALIEGRLRYPAPTSDLLTVRLTHKAGDLIWTEQRIVPILDADGSLVAIEGIVRNISKRKRLEAELAEAHRRFADSREQARLFLARELHDNAVQQLLGISYQLAAYGRCINAGQPPAPEAGGDIGAILSAVRQATLRVARQIRSLIGELRPAGLEEFGLTTALRGYVTHLSRQLGQQQAQISLDLVETGTDLPRLVALCLFRVAQEALRNALKHAAARHIKLTLDRSAEKIVLAVSDDGRGFEVPQRLSELAKDNHFGLIGMAEWVAWADGQLTIESQPGRGGAVTVVIPLTAPVQPHDEHAAPGP